MKVCHLIAGLGLGGAEMMLCNLLRGLTSLGVQSSVLSLSGSGELASHIERLGIPVAQYGMGYLSCFPGMRKVVSRLREFRPDVTQTWMYQADAYGGIASRLAGVNKVVWGIHNGGFPPGYSNQKTLLIAKGCALLSRRIPSRIVSCSVAAQKLHESLGYDKSRMVHIPNGFDTVRFAPDAAAGGRLRGELGVAENDFLVGMVARFDPVKDHETFVRAAAIFHVHNPRARFVMCGKDVDHQNAAIRRWLGSGGVGGRFLLLGKRDDVSQLMNAMDVVTCCSKSEAFPNVVGEAMACGVPCVVTDVGDCALMVGDTGVVVSPGDPDALAGAWAKLGKMDAGSRRRLGELGRQRVLEHYSLDRMVRRYLELYQTLGGKRGD